MKNSLDNDKIANIEHTNINKQATVASHRVGRRQPRLCRHLGRKGVAIITICITLILIIGLAQLLWLQVPIHQVYVSPRKYSTDNSATGLKE